jgi:xanthine/uracil/vitamin C permease (AzgA family)
MFNDFWLWLEYLPLAGHIGATWWFPLMESLHVLSITMLLGAILMVDLRVLGLAACRYTVLQVSKELVPWAAVSFVIATVTGLAMFITRASVHIVNPAFQIKLLLIFLAGINIAMFHFKILRSVADWNTIQVAPSSARLAAGISLGLWCGVMLAGRWVGHVI